MAEINSGVDFFKWLKPCSLNHKIRRTLKNLTEAMDKIKNNNSDVWLLHEPRNGFFGNHFNIST